MFEKIRDVISEKIGIDKEKITMESSFVGDLNIDSISMIDLIMELEDEYGIEFDEDDADNIKTIADVIEYINKLSWFKWVCQPGILNSCLKRCYYGR